MKKIFNYFVKGLLLVASCVALAVVLSSFLQIRLVTAQDEKNEQFQDFVKKAKAYQEKQKALPKWEYNVTSCETSVKTMNSLGAEGWELVSVNDCGQATFKRSLISSN